VPDSCKSSEPALLGNLDGTGKQAGTKNCLAPALVAAALALALLLGAPQQPAHATSASVRLGECNDEWDDAPANQYCPRATVAVHTAAGAQQGYCVVNGRCSITVSVDGQDTAYTPTMDLILSKDSTDTIDICFQLVTLSSLGTGSAWDLTWISVAKAGCAAGEANSAAASSSGLSTER